MLKVGLTGGLGSGKSAVAAAFAEEGAHVFSADEIGRALMQPGQPVYAQIVEHFGTEVLGPGGQLDRRALARQAFAGGRLEELNALVHPAVLRAQAALLDEIERNDPQGIAVVESALIFEVSGEMLRAAESTNSGTPTPEDTKKGRVEGWRSRFDRLVLVTAPDELKVVRYVSRQAPLDATPSLREQLAADARARLAAQIPDSEKIPFCDFVIENRESLVLLRRRAHAVLAALRQR